MANISRIDAFKNAQVQIIILTAFKPLAPATHSPDIGGPVNAQMIQVVLRAKKLA